MAEDILGNIDKKFEIGKMTAKSTVNQTLIVGLINLLLTKNLITPEEVAGLILDASDEMEKRTEFAESLMPDQTAGAKADADKRRRRIRKEYKILLQRFERSENKDSNS